MFELVTSDDAAAIADIYNKYIAETTITFEIDPVSSEEMQERIAKVRENYPWITYKVNDELAGFAYLTRFRDRAAYDHVAESSIYLRQDVLGKGIGRAMYKYLIWLAPDYGIREIVGVIALPNNASEQLHQRLGFAKRGVIKRAGFKFGVYVDTAYWQLSIKDGDA